MEEPIDQAAWECRHDAQRFEAVKGAEADARAVRIPTRQAAEASAIRADANAPLRRLCWAGDEWRWRVARAIASPERDAKERVGMEWPEAAPSAREEDQQVGVLAGAKPQRVVQKAQPIVRAA
jgi:hypothetical protein